MINIEPARQLRFQILSSISILLLVLALAGCRQLPTDSPAQISAPSSVDPNKPEQHNDPFSAFMETQYIPADGFHSPTSNAASNNQPSEVSAVANGRVNFIGESNSGLGKFLIIEHIIYQNHQREVLLSIYAQLDQIKVSNGAQVMRGQSIGTLKQGEKLFLRLRWNINLAPDLEKLLTESPTGEFYPAPESFIKTHQQLFIPHKEPVLVLIDQESYRMQFYRLGKLQGQYDVSFGQAKGVKAVQGDRKTPKGSYFVVSKHRGEFSGPYGAYYGGHWIKINYPNRYDAQRGLDEKLITPAQAASIEKAWQQRALTPQETRLGGGIGFHGWIKEWSNDGPRHLSWGCVVLHNFDIEKLYDQIPVGAMVVIF